MHGFIPTRGTLTAWKQISSETLRSRNILEIDIKGFFPSVTPTMARRAFRVLEISTGKTTIMPTRILQYLTDINWSKPSLPLNETKTYEPYLLSASSITHHTYNKLHDAYLKAVRTIYRPKSGSKAMKQFQELHNSVLKYTYLPQYIRIALGFAGLQTWLRNFFIVFRCLIVAYGKHFVMLKKEREIFEVHNKNQLEAIKAGINAMAPTKDDPHLMLAAEYINTKLVERSIDPQNSHDYSLLHVLESWTVPEL